MTKRPPLSLVLALLVAAFALACPRHRAGNEATSSAQTQTIAPAVAQPAPTGTDSMTQTVDIEDSRSEDDGGAITNPQAAQGTAAKPAGGVATKKATKKH